MQTRSLVASPYPLHYTEPQMPQGLEMGQEPQRLLLVPIW